MGVEVMSSAETGEGNSSMKFGSVGETPLKGEPNNVSVNGELSKASEGNLPNNVREEWPEPTQIHSFYAVKYRPYEDEKLKGLLDQADKELQKIYKARSACLEKLRPLRGERQQLMSLIIPLNTERKQYRAVIDGKRKEMEPLQKNLGQLRNTMGGGGRERGAGGGREKGSGLCSSEAELNAYIKSLQYRIQHESITLNEEKQILRDIKQLESTREKVIANAVTRAKIEESVGDKATLQEQVKLIGVDLDGVRKEQDALMTKLKKLEAEKGVIDDKIKLIEEELNDLDAKKMKANENLDGLKAKLRDVNAPFYQNNNLLKTFRDVAAKKDIESLKQQTEAEVEKFVSQWGSKKAFREDYEKRILLSLDMRQLSKDGRMRNPDEKPLVRPNTVVPTEAVTKQPKEDVVSTQKKDAAATTEKVSKEKVSKVPKEANNKKKDGLVEQSENTGSKDADSDFEIPQKDPPKVEKVDKEKLKEIKREEEIAKNKQALERKKKLAEKAAAKAAMKAQKEAEEKQKKQKEREKKARRRVGPTAESQDESNEANGVEQEVADEEENAEEKIEQAVPSQKRERKENGIRSRPRPRSTGTLPKAILKRKKATNYWPYYAAAAAVAVLLLLAVGYNYFA